MIRQTFPIEIITPCFCAGADQSKAEIRASSIRGQLRWWFRLVDHDPNHEAMVFGSVAGEDDCTSASLTVRVTDFRSSGPWRVPQINQSMPENYVWHFASVSGTRERGAKGPRWNSVGAISPGSKFILELIWKRQLPSSIANAFKLALHSFLSLGTLGLRSTRGLGAIHCADFPDAHPIEADLRAKGFILSWRDSSARFASYETALRDYASWLRYDFRQRFKAKRPSPLGSSSPTRQASAVRFRCFKRSDGGFSWLAYEAPHSRVLGLGARTGMPVLEGMSFRGRAPVADER